MSYYYEVIRSRETKVFETLSVAKHYQAKFGGVLYLVMENGDRAELTPTIENSYLCVGVA